MISFDERARDWDSDPAKVERARVVADAIRSAVPLKPDMTALEYGCGTGLLSFALQNEFKSITMVDTSQGMLEVLSEKIQAAGVTNMHPLRLDLTTEPPPDSHYGIIYSLMALHHIANVDRALAQFHEMLDPGGHLVISDLEKEDGSFHGEHVMGVHHGFDRNELKHKIEAAGFQSVRFASVLEIRRNLDSVEKKFALFLMTAEKTE